MWFIILSLAITNILASSHLLDWIKPDKAIFYCYMCIGFWVGFGLSFTKFAIGPWYVCALTSCLMCDVFGAIMNRLSHEN
jgi:hypothetical protein